MRLLLLCLTLTVCAFAQQASTTSLIGRVMDSGGAVIPNATVKAVEEGTQETLTRTTNGAGLYYFELVRIGTYTITATANGFGAMTRSGVVVETNWSAPPSSSRWGRLPNRLWCWALRLRSPPTRPV